MAPQYRHTLTNLVADVSERYAAHPVLGRHLVPFDPETSAEEFEEDKVVLEKAPSTQRVKRTATPKKDQD